MKNPSSLKTKCGVDFSKLHSRLWFCISFCVRSISVYKVQKAAFSKCTCSRRMRDLVIYVLGCSHQRTQIVARKKRTRRVSCIFVKYLISVSTPSAYFLGSKWGFMIESRLIVGHLCTRGRRDKMSPPVYSVRANCSFGGRRGEGGGIN